MNANGEHVSVRRILLAMDPFYRSLGAVETAAELAAGLRAELIAVFVEDERLLHLASLPFAGEIGSLSCCLRPLTLEELERQMRAQAGEMRKALEAAACRLGVRWSFHVKRGMVGEQILQASREADLVILGKRGWNLSRRLGSTVQLMIASGQGMALLLQQQGEHLKVPVVAIYNDSPNGSKVLEAARTLADVKKGKMMVLVVAGDWQKAQELQLRAKEYMKSHNVEGEISAFLKPRIPLLAQVIRGLGPVVMACEESFYGHEDLCELVNVAENPFLLIR